MKSTCRQCQGSRVVIKNPCIECHGKGSTVQHKKVTVPVPAGTYFILNNVTAFILNLRLYFNTHKL